MSAQTLCRVSFAANFGSNLDTAKLFFEEIGAPEGFDALVDLVFHEVVPSLARFPDLGADFLERRCGSLEVLRQVERIAELVPSDASLRQLVFGPYVFLYLRHPDEVVLLAVRHGRQLSFDFAALWPESESTS